jgi:hypothetical protein
LTSNSALDQLVREAPSGLPFSDGEVRAVRTGQKLKRAFKNYQKAVKAYRSFVIDGVVPDGEKPADG